ncbi:MAG: AAA family ATPase [Microscillaceae bacterium]|nr:AAA family ATPase [Microscillaceae bacterium]
MPELLNALERTYYFDTLRFALHQSHLSLSVRLQQLHTCFLSLINALTEQRERQVFTGWFAKITFLAQAYQLGPDREAMLQALRRLFRRNLMAESRFIPQEGHLALAIKIVAELVADFSNSPIPEELLQYYLRQTLPELRPEAPLPQTVEDLQLVIVKKGPLEPLDAHRQEIWLEGDSEKYGRVQVQVQDRVYFSQAGKPFRKYALSQHCAALTRPYQALRLTQMQVRENGHWQTTAQSLLVASPDYLVDVSAIARCQGEQFRSPYLYFIQRMRFFEGNLQTFRGNLLNYLLDLLIEKGEMPFANALAWVLPEVQIEAAMLGLDQARVQEAATFIQPFYQNLVKVVGDYQSARLTTEPSFISARYGLQGRLDVLVEYPDQPQRKDIIELKGTGFPKAEMAIARREHLVQVAGYNLLLENTYQNRQGVSAILYAQDLEKPLRNAGKLDFEVQDAMWLRNCMVYIDLKMAEGKTAFYDAVLQKLEQERHFPPYLQNDIDRFAHRWRQASDLEKTYFAAMAGLVVREMLVAKVGGVSGGEPSQGFASLWRNAPDEKRARFALLYPLTIESVSENGAELIFARSQPQEITAFREGDIVVLYPVEEDGHLSPQQFPLLKGNLTQLSPGQVGVKLWSQAVHKAWFTHYQTWAIEPNLLESSFRHLLASLGDFLGFQKEQKQRYLGLVPPRFDLSLPLPYFAHLSEEQNAILHQALRAEDYFLLQGPPGTGKTSQMLRTMVAHLYQQQAETLVLLAFTNRATDEICEKIQEACEGNFIRLGNLNRQDTYWPYSLKSLPDVEAIRQRLQNARVLVATVASFYQYLHLLPRYDTVIVDEASQLLEPHLCGILPRFRRFILIGDEKQLPAVVTQAPGFCHDAPALLEAIGLGDLSTSVFERLLGNAQQRGWTESYAMLTRQYRTHQEIAQFISREFYHTLEPGSARQEAPFIFLTQKALTPGNASWPPPETFFAQPRRGKPEISRGRSPHGLSAPSYHSASGQSQRCFYIGNRRRNQPLSRSNCGDLSASGRGNAPDGQH